MSAYSKQFLGGQLAEAKRRLEDSERAAMRYARSAGLIDASAGASHKIETGPKSLTTASLVELNDAYSAARAGRVQAQQRWQQAQATGAMNLPEVLSNPTVQQLSQRRAELQAQYQEETQRRQADHPAVQQLSAKIGEIDRQISGLAANIRSSIRDQFMVAQRQEAALRGNVSQLKSETLSEQDRGIQYNILRREVDTSREMYDGLLQRYKQVSAAAGIASNNVAIVDRAPPPVDPISPRALLNLLLATLAGLSLSLFAVFFRERFVNKIRDPEDVDRFLRAPVLGVVPLVLKGETPHQALADPRSPHCEAHNSIGTSLEFSSTTGAPSTLLVTSSRPAEGKSTTALSLAISFASGGKRVLLVDADLRRPSLHLLLSQENETGLVHLLTRAKDVHEVVQTTGVPNLYFIGSGPTPPNPAQLLSSETLGTLLSTLSRGYDVVIVDGPPVMGLADAPRLAAAAAGTIFVVEAGQVQERLAGRALQRLRSSHARILGVVLTKYDSKQRGYGTEYDYGYYGYGYDLKQASRDTKRSLRHLLA
jgi:capsular exopolysaccharide synthesis family protein